MTDDAANFDFLIIPIHVPCEVERPPKGCTYYSEISPTISTLDPGSIQFQAGYWGESPREIVQVSEADCDRNDYTAQWDCQIAWTVPAGAWGWAWVGPQGPLTAPRCVWGIDE